MLSVLTLAGVAAGVIIGIIEMLDKVLNDGVHAVTGELGDCHILGGIHELGLAELNREVMLKIEHGLMFHTPALIVARRVGHRDGLGPMIRTATKETFGLGGVGHNRIAKRDEQAAVESTQVAHGLGVDVLSVANVEVSAALGANPNLTLGHQLFNAEALLAEGTQAFVNRAFELGSHGAVGSGLESKVGQLAPGFGGGHAHFKLARERVAVGLALAGTIAVFYGVALKVAGVEVTQETMAAAALGDIDLDGADVAAVFAHTNGNSTHD